MRKSISKKGIAVLIAITFLAGGLGASVFAGVLQGIDRTLLHNGLKNLENFNCSISKDRKIGVDIPGFLVPLFVSIVLGISAWINRPNLSNGVQRELRVSIILMVLAFSFITLLPAFLERWGIIIQGIGGLNYLALGASSGYMSFIVFVGSEKFSNSISYGLGFVACLISDISTTLAHYGILKSSIFGGYGLIDGDFWIPIGMTLANWCVYKWVLPSWIRGEIKW